LPHDVLTSRSEAKAAGLLVYFTGIACPKGHISQRRTHNGECCECGRSAARRRSALVPADTKKHRDSAYRERNREDISARRRQKWAESPRRNPEAEAKWNAGQGKKYKSEWARTNKIRLNEKAREWKRANADKVKAAKADYYQRNPHISLLEAHRRRGRARNAEGHFTHEDVKRIFAMQKGKCAACGKKRKLTIDHIKPLVKGGSNWPSNLQGLCSPCNCKKQARDPIEFMQSQGALL
jgi:5-methylcytosine-specific restriction endonuclease McrA